LARSPCIRAIGGASLKQVPETIGFPTFFDN
jgi:hypothetical protein